jgi:hypothetical protein
VSATKAPATKTGPTQRLEISDISTDPSGTHPGPNNAKYTRNDI